MSAAWCCITQNFPKKDVSSMIPPLYVFDTSPNCSSNISCPIFHYC
jgi:hypothetical protein